MKTEKTGVSPSLKVAIVGSVGLPARYGGFETLVDQLSSFLLERYELHVYCSSKRYSEKLAEYNGARLHYVPLDANGISSIPYDLISMLHGCRYADVIIVLGVSGCAFLPIIKMISDCRIIVNVDGVEWRREKWNRPAKGFLKWSEKMAVKHSHAVVSDNAAIKSYIFDEYGSESECIAYGGDHVDQHRKITLDVSEYPFLASEYAVKVCRIEPENNVHVVLAAFARIATMNIVMIGNWAASGYGIHLKNAYSAFPNIYLLDPIYDQSRLNTIRSRASLYVHGHSAGGTNPSLVEAMWLALPVVSFDVHYNRATTCGKALYFDGEDSLVECLLQKNTDKLLEIGTQMGAIAKERYSWRLISSRYSSLIDAQISDISAETKLP